VGSLAAELEAALREWMDERLTLEDAAEERGLNYDAMRKRLERGVYVNVGKKGAPRIRRADLYNGQPREVSIVEQVLAGLDK